MFKINETWKDYYEELNPEKRKDLLRAHLQEEDDGANALREALFEKRYTDPRDPGRKVDFFLMQCLILTGVFRSRNFPLVKARMEVEKTRSVLGLENAGLFSEAEEAACYFELRNAARRYFTTCTGTNYGKSLFGLKKSTPSLRRDQALREGINMSVGICRAAGMEEEMRLWIDAVRDAFADIFEDGAALFDERLKELEKEL